MNNQITEAMGILQEECAEVIVEISKIRRFGLDTAHFKSDMQQTHRTMLEIEIGDVMALIDILQELDVVSWTNIERAAAAKRDKLKIWSTIFNENIS